MSIERGDKIHLADGIHEVVGVEKDAVFFERLEDQTIRRYTPLEAETLIQESQKNGWYQGPWPFTVISYAHGEQWGLDEEFKNMGLSEEERHMFRFPIHELKLELELHRNGDVFILSVNGRTFEEEIKAT